MKKKLNKYFSHSSRQDDAVRLPQIIDKFLDKEVHQMHKNANGNQPQESRDDKSKQPLRLNTSNLNSNTSSPVQPNQPQSYPNISSPQHPSISQPPPPMFSVPPPSFNNTMTYTNSSSPSSTNKNSDTKNTTPKPSGEIWEDYYSWDDNKARGSDSGSSGNSSDRFVGIEFCV